jgi:glycosyltransferase involved in cell wall biosynthesis
MRPGVPNPLAAVRLLRIIQKKRPHILQTWMYHADLLGLLVGKLAHVPSIVWNIQCSNLPDDGWLSALVRRMLVTLSPLPDAVLANSQSGLRFHKDSGYRPRRWLYIPNSLDLTEFRPNPKARNWLRTELRLRSNAILVGLIARFHPVKDHYTFIEAARLLAAGNSAINFVLAGLDVDRENRDLIRMIKSTGVEDRFHVLGHRADVNRITAALDLSCSSSYSEGSSNVIAEAMACGVPCVATDVGDASIVLQDFGKVVPPKDPAALARACRGVLGMSSERRCQLGLAARARVEEYFSLHAVVDSYQGLYEQLAPAQHRFSNGALKQQSKVVRWG